MEQTPRGLIKKLLAEGTSMTPAPPSYLSRSTEAGSSSSSSSFSSSSLSSAQKKRLASELDTSSLSSTTTTTLAAAAVAAAATLPSSLKAPESAKKSRKETPRSLIRAVAVELGGPSQPSAKKKATTPSATSKSISSSTKSSTLSSSLLTPHARDETPRGLLRGVIASMDTPLPTATAMSSDNISPTTASASANTTTSALKSALSPKKSATPVKSPIKVTTPRSANISFISSKSNNDSLVEEDQRDYEEFQPTRSEFEEENDEQVESERGDEEYEEYEEKVDEEEEEEEEEDNTNLDISTLLKANNKQGKHYSEVERLEIEKILEAEKRREEEQLERLTSNRSLVASSKAKTVPSPKTTKSKSASTNSLHLSPAVTKSIFSSFSKSKVTPAAMEVVQKGVYQFLTQVSDDLLAYSQHAKRKTIEQQDVVFLLKRQSQISKHQSFETLVHDNLPMEYIEAILPIARANNVVFPKKKH